MFIVEKKEHEDVRVERKEKVEIQHQRKNDRRNRKVLKLTKNVCELIF